MKELARRARTFAAPYRVEKGKGFRLDGVDPADTAELESEDVDRAK